MNEERCHWREGCRAQGSPMPCISIAQQQALTPCGKYGAFCFPLTPKPVDKPQNPSARPDTTPEKAAHNPYS